MNRFEALSRRSKAVLLAACLLLPLLAAEAGVRILYAATNRTVGGLIAGEDITYIPYLGYKYGANEVQKVHFETDDHGFIKNAPGTRNLAEKPPKVFRIFMLGGSTVVGSGSDTMSDTIPAQLAAMLEKEVAGLNADWRVEVVNAGVSAYFSAQEHLLLSFGLMQFEPDLVVFFDGTNDFMAWGLGAAGEPDFLNHNYHNVQAKLFSSLRRTQSLGGALGNLALELTRYCALLDALYRVTTRPERLNLFVQGLTGDGVADETTAAIMDTIVARYRDNIVRSIGFAKVNDLAMVQILQPTMLSDANLTPEEKRIRARVNEKWHGSDYFDNKAVFYDRVRAVYAELSAAFDGDGVVVHDMSAIFAEKSPETTLYADHVHYTPAGNAMIAERMTPLVLPFVRKAMSEAGAGG